MERYRNLSGHSGVTGYQLGDDAILVRFVNGDVYEYTATRPGRTHLRNMRTLARAGLGLATYISRFVRDNYARKLT